MMFRDKGAGRKAVEPTYNPWIATFVYANLVIVSEIIVQGL